MHIMCALNNLRVMCDMHTMCDIYALYDMCAREVPLSHALAMCDSDMGL